MPDVTPLLLDAGMVVLASHHPITNLSAYISIALLSVAVVPLAAYLSRGLLLGLALVARAFLWLVLLVLVAAVIGLGFSRLAGGSVAADAVIAGGVIASLACLAWPGPGWR